MSTRFLSEAELRADYGDAAVTSLAAKMPSPAFVENSILDAEDEAMGYLRGYTGIPTSPEVTSRRLKVLVGQLAYYNLHRGMASTPFRARDGREIAIKGLGQIRSGELSIASASAPENSLSLPAVAAVRRTSREDAPITLQAMRDWGHR